MLSEAGEQELPLVHKGHDDRPQQAEPGNGEGHSGE